MNKANLNPNFKQFEVDYLYHLGIDTTMNIQEIFGHIKYVVFTLSNTEAATISREFAIAWYNINEHDFKYQPLYKTERFHLYKVGITLIISIGVGGPSLLIAMTEITKLLVHLKLFNVEYFKLGLANGLGTEPGDIVVSYDTLNAKFENQYKSIECGKSISYPLTLNKTLTQRFHAFCLSLGKKNVILGTCQSTKISIEEQCYFSHLISPPVTSDDVNAYLTKSYNLGVRCIDMESMAFAGFCNQLNINASIISVIMSNYLTRNLNSSTIEEHLNSTAKAAKYLAGFIKSNML